MSDRRLLRRLEFFDDHHAGEYSNEEPADGTPEAKEIRTAKCASYPANCREQVRLLVARLVYMAEGANLPRERDVLSAARACHLRSVLGGASK